MSRLFKPRVCSGSRLRSTLRASPTTKPMAATLAMNKNGNWTAGELQDDCNFLLYSIHLGIKAEREKMVKRVTGAGRKSGPRQESEAKADIDAEAKKLREREEDLMAKVVAAMKGGSAPETGRGIGNWRPSAADAGSAEAPARKKARTADAADASPSAAIAQLSSGSADVDAHTCADATAGRRSLTGTPFNADSLDNFVKLVAAHLRPASACALQNGGVGDQLPKVLDEKLQRIEANQTRLTELAASEYTKRNEESVRAAAVKKYMKANKHDPDFVEEAKAAYVQKKEGTIKAAAAELYMEAHAEDEDFREEAVEAYIVKHKACPQLLEAAAAKYCEENEDDEQFVEAAKQKYAEDHEDDIKDEASKEYIDEHQSDEEFIEAAKEKYVEDHEDEIRDEAVDRYKDEHEGDKDFIKAARRLYAENM